MVNWRFANHRRKLSITVLRWQPNSSRKNWGYGNSKNLIKKKSGKRQLFHFSKIKRKSTRYWLVIFKRSLQSKKILQPFRCRFWLEYSASSSFQVGLKKKKFISFIIKIPKLIFFKDQFWQKFAEKLFSNYSILLYSLST